MSSDSLTIQCPAKVNLALSLGAPRPDDGLHPICSWMVAVGFGDTLKLTRSTTGDSACEILIADNAPSPQRIDWPLESDLAFRAHGLLQRHVNRDLPIHMQLTKRIPSGAGLGGGSSDAAGMLAAVNGLFELGLGDETLKQLGLRLGSDVGFMVAVQLGTRSAVVAGVGEQIEPAGRSGVVHLVLIFPPHRCGTAEVYRCFDAITEAPRVRPERVRALARTGVLSADGPFNDLTAAAYEVVPALRDIHRDVCAATGKPVHLSGSGAAMFVVAQSGAEAQAMAANIREQTGLPALATRTLP